MTEKTREEREFQIRFSEIETDSEYLGNYIISFIFAGLVGLFSLAIEFSFNPTINWNIISFVFIFTCSTVVGVWMNDYLKRRIRRKYQVLREEYGLSRNEED